MKVQEREKFRMKIKAMESHSGAMGAEVMEGRPPRRQRYCETTKGLSLFVKNTGGYAS